ncbi:carbon storage regulator [Sphingobium yanoikuyae]|mgnify:CR=1 FL=1|uniref:carbon storage regulator n=1 Tax=Sphingobium yanoikuyae TaxID=13690 RepID=UPI0024330179|nr:carbon storage regulator [Sphingobium yanoikuyae]
MLKLDIRVGESVTIGDGIVLSLEKKSGQLARIAIRADPSLKIRRLEQAPVPPGPVD